MDELTQNIALILGASWASGINLYAAVLVLGLMGATGAVDLPPGLDLLTEPPVLIAAAAMFLAEFFADKIPGVDTAWDGIHTFIRIPAGALMAMGAAGDMGPAGDMAMALLGGSVAAASHAAKSGTRVLINTSPEPFSNWAASIGEDIGVVGGLLLALKHPAVFLVALACFFLLLIWLLPKLWQGIKRVFGAIGRLFGAGKGEPEPARLEHKRSSVSPTGSPPARLDAPSAGPVPGSERRH